MSLHLFGHECKAILQNLRHLLICFVVQKMCICSTAGLNYIQLTFINSVKRAVVLFWEWPMSCWDLPQEYIKRLIVPRDE